MAKAIINKHIDSVQDVVLTELFIKDEENNKGELLICNDPDNPTIYIMDTTGNPRKIAGGNIDEVVETLTKDIDDIDKTVKTLDGTVTGITETVDGISGTVETITETVDGISGTIETISGTVDGISGTVDGVTENLSTINTSIGEIAEGSTLVGMINDVQSATEVNAQAITDNKTIIDEYTVNGKKISENPVLNTDDILVADNYSTLTKPADNVYPGDIITTAISKIEIMLANTTLALTAAINDLEHRLQTLEDLYNESTKEPEV